MSCAQMKMRLLRRMASAAEMIASRSSEEKNFLHASDSSLQISRSSSDLPFSSVMVASGTKYCGEERSLTMFWVYSRKAFFISRKFAYPNFWQKRSSVSSEEAVFLLNWASVI